MNENDEKVLQELGMGNLAEDEKKAVLALIDQRLEKRFVANLLMSLDDETRKKLEDKIEAMPEPKVDDVVAAAIELAPEAPQILERSANEIIEELKKEKPAAPAELQVASNKIQDTNSSGVSDSSRPATSVATGEYYG